MTVYLSDFMEIGLIKVSEQTEKQMESVER